MNSEQPYSTGTDWCRQLEKALAALTADSLHLYQGDDRLQLMARRRTDSQVDHAGVLVPIVADATPGIVLTQRSRHLRSHPGQISFPGGRYEATDADLRTTAVREAQEEIGLDPSRLRILGRLPEYITGTGFNITPYVACLEPRTRFRANRHEVERIFSVPLAYAMTPAHYRIERRDIDGYSHRFHVLEHGGNHIWGATAAMLYGLCTCMNDAAASASS